MTSVLSTNTGKKRHWRSEEVLKLPRGSEGGSES